MSLLTLPVAPLVLLTSSLLLASTPAPADPSASPPDTPTDTPAETPADASSAESIKLNAVQVTARRNTLAGGQVSTETQLGALGDRNVFDTPFSTSSYTDQLIRDQQARTLSDVLDNDASVRAASSRYTESSILAIRGFQVNAGTALFAGLPGLVDSREPDLDGIERVDVFKGPSALVNNGANNVSVGGTINFVPKRATADPINRLTLGYDSDAESEAHLDVGRRFGPDQAYGARINLGGRVGDTPIDNQFERAGSGSLGLDYQGQRLRASLDLAYQSRQLKAELSDYLVDPGFAIPKAPKASTNLFDGSTYYKQANTLAVGQIEYDLFDHVTAFAAYGHNHTIQRYKGPYGPEITNAEGDANVFVIPYVLNGGDDAARIGLRGSFDTGPVAHQITLSADGFWNRFGVGSTVNDTLSTNLYEPRPLAQEVPDYPDPPVVYGLSTRRSSIAVADVATLWQGRLTLIGGLRRQTIATRNFNPSTNAETSAYDRFKTTPAIAALFKLTPRWSVYGNYIEALQSGPTAPQGAVNANQVFAPLVAKQVEAGTKYDLGSGGITFAAFQIQQPSGIIDPATKIFSGDGEQRNRGLELNLFGTVARGLRLIGGGALLDGVQVRTGDANQGKTAYGTPRDTVNLGSEWDLPFLTGLTATARGIYTSKQFYDADNSRSIPGWARLDLGARYAFATAGHELTLRAAVENVTGENYWGSAQQGVLTRGAPRTVLVSMATDF